MTNAATQEPATEQPVEKPTQALTVRGPELPEPVVRRGITEGQWRMLFNLFPGAKPDSALMVWDYCKARGLDPMKKPCHIVPMRVKVNNEWVWRDVVMPGIYEYRTTAHRTGLYLGHTKPVYGPSVAYAGVDAPEWCEMTMLRWHKESGRSVEFPVRVFFAEVVATKQDGNVNERWTKAPTQMLTKCTEAAGLREAFPEEFGGEPTAEEIEGQRVIDVGPVVIPDPVRRSEKALQAAPSPAADDVEEIFGPDDRPAEQVEPVESAPPAQAAAQPSAEKPAPATNRQNGPRPAPQKSAAPAATGPAVTTQNMVITETAVVHPKGQDPFWEVKAVIQEKGKAPVGFVFMTRDEGLYKTAASCEGTETKFHITWAGGKRTDGSACKVLQKIEAAN